MEKTLEYIDKKGNKMLFSSDDICLLKNFSWYLYPSGYFISKINEVLVPFSKAVMIRRGIKVPNGFVVDHINSIKTDNRFENLQVLTKAENTIKALREIHGEVKLRKTKKKISPHLRRPKNKTYWREKIAFEKIEYYAKR